MIWRGERNNVKMLVEVLGKKLEQGRKLRTRESSRGEEENSWLSVAFRTFLH